MYHCLGFHRMECASCNQNDFITKRIERETFDCIRGMCGGTAEVRLGPAHHLHQIEHAVTGAAPALHFAKAFIKYSNCVCIDDDDDKKIN